MIRPRRVPLVAAAGVVLSLLAPGGAAHAGPDCTISWAGPVSGAWESALNWKPYDSSVPRAPGADDRVCITAVGTYTVTVTSAVAAARVRVAGGPTLLLSAGTGRAAEVTVAAVLQVDAGSALVLGESAQSAGRAAVTAGEVNVFGQLRTAGSPQAERVLAGAVIADRAVLAAPTTVRGHLSAHDLDVPTSGRLLVAGGSQDVESSWGGLTLNTARNEGGIETRAATVGFGDVTGKPVRVVGGAIGSTRGAMVAELSGTVSLRDSATDSLATLRFVGGQGTTDVLELPYGLRDGRARIELVQTGSGQGGTALVRAAAGTEIVQVGPVLARRAPDATAGGTLRFQGPTTFTRVFDHHRVEVGAGMVLEAAQRTSSPDQAVSGGPEFRVLDGGTLVLPHPSQTVRGEHVRLEGTGVLRTPSGVAFPSALTRVDAGRLTLVGTTRTVPGRLVNAGVVDVRERAALRLPGGYTGPGTLALSAADAVVESPSVRIEPDTGGLVRAALTGYGTVRGNVTAAGAVAPGSYTELRPGRLTVTGDLSAVDLRVPVIGPAAADAGRLTVGGTLTLPSSYVEVLTPNGWTPEKGTRWRLVDAAAVSGQVQQPPHSLRPGRTPGHPWDDGPPYAAEQTARTLDLVAVGRRDVTAVTGTDNQLWLRFGDDRPWTPGGGRLVESPVVVAADGGGFVLGVGADHNVWYRSVLSPSWAPLGPEGTSCSGASAVVSAGVLAVVCRGSDGGAWVGRTTVGWGTLSRLSGWSPLRGSVRYGVAVSDVSSTGTGPRFLYSAVGTDDRPWQRGDSGGWTQLSSQRCGGDLGAEERGKAFACRDLATEALRTFAADGTTTTLGGRVTGRPAVTTRPQEATRFYALGLDRSVWYAERRLDGMSRPFTAFGGAGTGGVSAVPATHTERPAG